MPLSDGTTALEFGRDGVLYSLTNRFSNLVGHLLTIDPSDGAATDLGLIGGVGDTPVALTSVPEPTSLAMLGLGGLISLGFVRRRQGLHSNI